MATIYVQRVLDTGLGQYVTYESVTVSMPTGATVPPGVGPYDVSTHTIIQRYDNAEPGVWPSVSLVADLPTVNVREGDQCWVITENAMYYANADGGSWAVASSGGGGVKPYTYVVGCSAAPYNDTLDVCDFLDPGDGTGIAACLAVAADYRDTIKIRPGSYDIDPSAVTLPLVIPFGCTVEGSGNATLVSIASGAGGYSQHAFTVNLNATLSDMSIFVEPPAADVVASLSHIECAEVCTISNINVEIGVGPESHSALAMFRADAGSSQFSNISVIVEDGFVPPFVFSAIMIGSFIGSTASSELTTPPCVSNISVNGDIYALITINASMGVVVTNLKHINIVNAASMNFIVNETPNTFAFRGPLVTNALIQYASSSTSTDYAITVENSNTGTLLGSAFNNVSVIGGTDALVGGVNVRNVDSGTISGIFVSNFTTCRVANMMFVESFNNGIVSGVKVSNHTWVNNEPAATFQAGASSSIVGVDLIACDVSVVQIGDVSRLRTIGGEGNVTLDSSGVDAIIVARNSSTITDGGTGTEVGHVLAIPAP